MKIKIYKTKQKVARAFSKYLYKLLGSQEITHIALSGGSTPKMVFKQLARKYADKIDWTKVHFYWGDERCVPPTDDESNYGMTAELLLSKIAIPPENIHRIKGENEPATEVLNYAALLEEILPQQNNIPRFDLVILGMGDDGHTASVFPHEIKLWHSEKNCEVAKHPQSGQKRITLTGKIINNATQVAFLVTGSGKAEKVREIIKKEGDYSSYPAALVMPRPGKLFWFLDAEAAKETF